MIMAFKATAAKRKLPKEYMAYATCSKCCLVALVFYSWLSFFSKLQAGVSCLVANYDNAADDMLVECQKGGLVKSCRESIDYLNRINSLQSKCPSSILGPVVGPLYLALVYIFRLIPSGIIGMFNLFTWTDKRFDSKEHSPEVADDHDDPVHQMSPKATHVLCLLCWIGFCCIVEAAVSNPRSLSSFDVVTTYVFAFSLLHMLKTNNFDDQLKRFILVVQKALFLTGTFHCIVDFVHRSIGIIFDCLGNQVIQEELRKTCKYASDRDTINECLQKIADLDFSSYFDRQDCPRNDMATFVLYSVNVLKVLALTGGTACVYAFSRSVDQKVNKTS